MRSAFYCIFQNFESGPNLIIKRSNFSLPKFSVTENSDKVNSKMIWFNKINQSTASVEIFLSVERTGKSSFMAVPIGCYSLIKHITNRNSNCLILFLCSAGWTVNSFLYFWAELGRDYLRSAWVNEKFL